MGVLANNHKNIITCPKVREAPKRGLGSTLFDKMRENNENLAQIDGVTGETETHASLLQRSIRTAIAMRARGVQADDIVSICSVNNLDVYVPFLGTLFLGAKLANLDPTLPVADTVHLLKQVQPKMLFVGPEAVKLIEQAIKETKIDTQIVVFGETDVYEKFSDFLVESPHEDEFKPVEVENVMDTAIIFFSSGTTGLPKGICISHYALLAQGYQNAEFVIGNQVIMMFSSLYWNSSALILVVAVVSANSFIIYPQFDPSTVWSLVEKHKVTVMGLAASRMLSTCKHGAPEGVDVSSLKLIIIAGTTMSQKQIEVVRKMVPGALVANTYGLTEVCSVALSFRPGSNKHHLALLMSKANSCGTIVPGFSYKVVDPDTEEILGANQRGELRLKSDFQMNGYFNMDSSDCWDSDGWLKTGDVAYYDEDLCFYIVDRIKEIFKYQCYHVIPTRLEEILLSHPAVQAAMVVPLPHEEDGNHPVGVVELNKTLDSVSAKELEFYVEEKVDDRQRLRGGVKIIDVMPLTPSGKMRRRDIIKMVREGSI